MTTPKSPILSPELVVINTPYAVTINPDDNYQFFNASKSERIKKSVNHMKYVMLHNPNFMFTLRLEISSKGRLHWHGVLTFHHANHIADFYMEFIHEFLTKHTMEIDTIADKVVSKKYASWEEYCNKQQLFKLPYLCTKEISKLKTANPNKIYKTIDEFAQSEE